ncbi:hypothetical protein Vafri_19 [Volvox africanus]|nr:hypothetical protein Vafri_19 [Volvox africanus]
MQAYTDATCDQEPMDPWGASFTIPSNQATCYFPEITKQSTTTLTKATVRTMGRAGPFNLVICPVPAPSKGRVFHPGGSHAPPQLARHPVAPDLEVAHPWPAAAAVAAVTRPGAALQSAAAARPAVVPEPCQTPGSPLCLRSSPQPASLPYRSASPYHEPGLQDLSR